MSLKKVLCAAVLIAALATAPAFAQNHTSGHANSSSGLNVSMGAMTNGNGLAVVGGANQIGNFSGVTSTANNAGSGVTTQSFTTNSGLNGNISLGGGATLNTVNMSGGGSAAGKAKHGS